MPDSDLESKAAFNVLNDRLTNVHMSVDGGTLKILIDLTDDHGPSKTGKNNIVATTHGAQDIPGSGGVRLGLNCFKKPPEKKKGGKKG